MDCRLALVVPVMILGACAGSDGESSPATTMSVGTTAAAAAPPRTTVAVDDPTTGPTTSLPPSTTTTDPARTVAPSTTSAPSTTLDTLALDTVTLDTTILETTDFGVDGSTGYVIPVGDVAAAGWGPGHSGYPATDIFAPCGAELVSPVDGVLLEVRTVDGWNPAADNPATRGGRSVSIRGNDAVRYYMAHLDEVDPALVPGGTVVAGRRLGTVGLTGRTSGCHVHFGISPPCPGLEWSVRRGVVEPAGYLDDWRAGVPTNPAAEVAAWSATNPDACDLAMADQFAADS